MDFVEGRWVRSVGVVVDVIVAGNGDEVMVGGGAGILLDCGRVGGEGKDGCWEERSGAASPRWVEGFYEHGGRVAIFDGSLMFSGIP